LFLSSISSSHAESVFVWMVMNLKETCLTDWIPSSGNQQVFTPYYKLSSQSKTFRATIFGFCCNN